MIHPHTRLQFISDEIGYGVVATKFIPKGTITWAQDSFDKIFTDEEVADMASVYKNIIDVYAFKNSRGEYILCWDTAKYVNHSFKSNCLTTPYDFEIAVKDIYPGDQLTDDYGYLNISHPFRAADEGTKRKTVYPDDLLRYHPVWDKAISKTFPLILKLHQPLLDVLPPATLKKVTNIIEGKETLDSILACYYHPNE
jgi:hypothetical protein